MTITVVGGGLAGLIAAIECAERGADVELVASGDFVANFGGHVVYQDGDLWRWLEARGLADAKKPPMTGVRFRHGGRLHHTPPLAALQAVRLFRRGGPDDRSLREWVTAEAGPEVADVASAMCHVFSFDHDPGRLAASFCTERGRRVYSLPPAARYFVGGWGAMVDRLSARARSFGVRITLGAPLDELPPAPVIVATSLAAARRLLDDDSVAWTGTRTAILDVGFRTRRGDPFVLFDLDDGVFVERYTAPDRTLAPAGHQLIQTQVGLRPDEERDREVWRRRYVVDHATGALDLPGTPWRDRPAIDRGDGVYLCGDMVSAPGLLGEVACVSAVAAAETASAVKRSQGVGQSLLEDGP